MKSWHKKYKKKKYFSPKLQRTFQNIKSIVVAYTKQAAGRITDLDLRLSYAGSLYTLYLGSWQISSVQNSVTWQLMRADGFYHIDAVGTNTSVESSHFRILSTLQFLNSLMLF